MREKPVKRIEQPYKPLAGADFTKPPAPCDQAVCLIFGQPGHGKTTLGLRYAPGPVAFFDIDRRGLHAAKVAQRKGQLIHYLPIELPQRVLKMSDMDLKKAADTQVSMVRKNLEIACRASEKGDIRTIVFDTMTEFATLIQLATTGRADRVKGDYGKSDHIMKTALADIIRMTRASQANFIMLAKNKPIWEGGEPTGKHTYRGPDTLEFEADWAGHMRLKAHTSIKKRRDAEAQSHELEITKAGIRLSTLGDVYSEEEWGEDGPFVYACVQQFPGSTAEDWK